MGMLCWKNTAIYFLLTTHHVHIIYTLILIFFEIGWIQWPTDLEVICLRTIITPVVPALWEAEAGRSLEVRSSRSAWPTW